MLQTSSHIWLPRSCTDESTFGPLIFTPSTNGEASSLLNIAKGRLDMHLAAACVRTSAQPLGRGMLGLGTLVASPPPLLAVTPLCLRGRVVVSSSGFTLPTHQDLARGCLVENRRANANSEMGFATSDHPGNAVALAIVAAVAATGCAGSLKVRPPPEDRFSLAYLLTRSFLPVDGVFALASHESKRHSRIGRHHKHE